MLVDTHRHILFFADANQGRRVIGYCKNSCRWGAGTTAKKWG